MAYVPGCRYDLFLSYASENNRDAWVEQFERALAQELGDLLGRQFDAKQSVFFDKRDLEVAQSFPDRLQGAARDSAILLPVLSPGYLTSPWCNRERTEFFSKLPQGAGLADCLAPVMVRPIDENGMDKVYRNAQRLSFLGPDDQTPVAVGSPEWTSRVKKLASQLKRALQALRRKCRPVFLGKAPDSERAQKLREWCCAELERRYFRTVPEALAPLDDADQVRASLQDAGLAVHFLGGSDSAALDAIETSVAVCSGPTILYQPFGSELGTVEQLWLGDFERELQAESGRYQRLTGKNDQELVAVIDENIAQIPSAGGAEETSKLELALVCEELDLEGIRQFHRELDVRRPTAAAFPDFLAGRPKSMERLRKWLDYFSRDDAQLFYHGAAGRDRLELLWQMAQQTRPNVPRCWFVTPPDLEDKRRQHPEALWTIEQAIQFVEGTRRAHA
jgi:TIR domain